MKKHFAEQSTLFISIAKWTAYASVVGVMAGASTAAFIRILQWATSLFTSHGYYFLLLPVTLFISSMLVNKLAPQAEGHGTEKVIEAIHTKMGRIPLMVVPVKLVATVITLASGGSAGKEGPAAQIGSGLASGFASLIRLGDIDRRKLVICGVSAGFASIFGTPIAGALFGVEVLFLGQMLYDVLFPSFVAGITGYLVAHALGVRYFGHVIQNVPPLSEMVFLQSILLGAWCGTVALLLIEGLKLGHRAFASIRWPRPYVALIGGAMLAMIGLLVSTKYLGLGLESIEAGLNGQPLPVGSFAWKILATSITLGSGGSGGIVTPIFFIGTASGNLFGQIFGGSNLASYSAIGMLAVLAGAANTPISASVMAMEFFGPAIGPYAAIACVVSFLAVGHRSVYPSQILSVQKSPSLEVTMGGPIGEVYKVKVLQRPGTLSGMLNKCLRRYRK
ncbi:MAG: chloride channel protein [Nitrospirota bacterium]